MKHWKFNITLIFIGWPTLIAGYLWAAICSGFKTGMFAYEADEDAAIDDHNAAQGAQEGKHD